MNPNIEIKKNNISVDQRTGRQHYAHTDKGIIFGSTAEVVQRKINRAGARPYAPPPKQERQSPDQEEELPF